MKKFLKVLLIILIAIMLCVVALFGWLTIKEYNPDDVVDLDIVSNDGEASSPAEGDTITVVGWNIGYAGLGEDSEFFMDGGEDVRSADKKTVTSYLQGIYNSLYTDNADADIYMLQEVDINSSRTFGINQQEFLGTYNNVHALNYACPFVPYPVPPLGRIYSGLLTNTVYDIASAERIALPCPFSWPVSTANLKRCLLVSYIPLENSDKQLVIVNLHLEAYDDGEGKIAQTNQLREFIQSEYEKGNYVIAGGDFNQIFPGGLEAYPNEHPDLWEPGIIADDMLPEGWTMAYDLSTPTCRLLNQPYDADDTENTQYYVIDGFLLSPNITLDEVHTLDYGFANSDHNPVRVTLTLDK